MEIEERTLSAQGERTWSISQYLCAFHDSERHLGHAMKTDSWHAYDATHLNLQKNGIRYLGDFPDFEAAKAAVEASVASQHEREAPGVNAQMPAWIF